MIRVLATKPHASILKAAALTGIGRANILDCSRMRSAPTSKMAPDGEGGEGPVGVGEDAEDDDESRYGLMFDLERVERELREAEEDGRAVIMAVALGEVNTVGSPCLGKMQGYVANV